MEKTLLSTTKQVKQKKQSYRIFAFSVCGLGIILPQLRAVQRSFIFKRFFSGRVFLCAFRFFSYAFDEKVFGNADKNGAFRLCKT